MTRTNWVLGSELSPELQREALARFGSNPHLSDIVPSFMRLTDAQWLARTRFAILASGERFDLRVKRCATDYRMEVGSK